ncbi:PREDICTED: ribonuclease II, chloroplastic/mitochondrial-like [Lupinus angustifolius]|uniref:ribonuclease II, chloroplastic/mitochondrial-like n=1 Tax=Lupinus angustifolius TaxID=3871 RepID=UPI00092E76DE|nr:PREDICTED: ribonuclease II, chloroplastic/mitochondrial-like [Lupinus angustifolius]
MNSFMAVRAFNPRYSLLSSPLRPSSFLHHRHTIPRCFHSLPFPSHTPFFSDYGRQSRSVHSLFESVMEELQAMRKRRKTVSNASNSKYLYLNMGLLNEELVEDRVVNHSLQKGLLLEFKGDSDRILLAVSQRPDGKKKWMVSDQNGVTSSIKPQQVTYIVPGIHNFDPADIADFAQKAQDNMDLSLLEFAWAELLEKNKSVTVEELAEMIFGSAEPLESYSAHALLSKDEVYFTVLETKGPCSIYGPRPSKQVEELILRKLAKEAYEKEFQEFIELLSSAKSMPSQDKPPKSSWMDEEKIRSRIESLEAYAIDACKNDEQRKTAGMILKDIGLAKTASSAVNLLADIGYFPVHVNLDLLKLGIPTDHSEENISVAQSLLSNSYDQDEINRKNLTDLKVYAIDVDEADELDDALSAKKLQDGRIKVWIHVADPTRYVEPGSIVDREAMRRGTSVFLPTATYPMFPEKLAMRGMSLRQGELCNAVTVSVVLHNDGSIAECSVVNSVIKPTYMLTYESASELLHLNLEEEGELRILSEAANRRLNWRRQQGAVDTATLDARIKVSNAESREPSINIYVENQAGPAMRMVSEMMILCGEAMATFGSRNDIPLPYRGQPQSYINVSEFAHLPEGPVRSHALVKVMRAAQIDFRKPVRHGVLGIPGYVQFTSPIRRYLDLLAHYQVKAFLRGEPPPFSPGKLEGIAAVVNMKFRAVRKLCSSSLRYWILEYLRRQPKEKVYRALVLRFIKDRIAALLLVEVGFQASTWVSVGTHIGDEILVKVEEAHPRDDIIFLKEVIKG